MRKAFRYRIRSGQKGHPRAAGPWSHVQEHILIAEAALGKNLPPLAEVHHVDGDGRNNAHRNLVICQDKAYHKLLHWRAKVIKLGGDPNTGDICGVCSSWKPFADFNRSVAAKKTGRCNRCRACSSATFKQWARKHRDERGVKSRHVVAVVWQSSVNRQFRLVLLDCGHRVIRKSSTQKPPKFVSKCEVCHPEAA